MVAAFTHSEGMICLPSSERALAARAEMWKTHMLRSLTPTPSWAAADAFWPMLDAYVDAQHADVRLSPRCEVSAVVVGTPALVSVERG